MGWDLRVHLRAPLLLVLIIITISVIFSCTNFLFLQSKEGEQLLAVIIQKGRGQCLLCGHHGSAGKSRPQAPLDSQDPREGRRRQRPWDPQLRAHKVSPGDRGILGGTALLSGILVYIKITSSEPDWPGRAQGWGACESCEPSVNHRDWQPVSRLLWEPPLRPSGHNNAGYFQGFIASVRVALNWLSNPWEATRNFKHKEFPLSRLCCQAYLD